MSFDYAYWGIFQDNLEEGEKIIQELANQYQLSMDNLCEIEEIAKENAQEIFSYADGFDNLTNIINTEKIKAAIALICQKRDLNEDDFDYEVNGNDIEVIYRNDRIA